MNAVILKKRYEQPPFCRREILRYAGCKEATSEVLALMESCIDEVQGCLSYSVCWCELPVTVENDVCEFGVFSWRSVDLATNLKGCWQVILFAATVGVEIDRLIAKYGHISPAKALMFQAIGAERIEALCNCFCEDMAKAIRPRFSPGYGDLPLEAQRDIFAVLDCAKQIGLSLNDSLLMSPSKSVTAIMGVL